MAKRKARITKEAFEKLSQGEKDLYAPFDDGAVYVLDVEAVDGWGLEDVHGLKSAYDKAMADKRALEKQLKDGGPNAQVSAELAAVKEELAVLKKADPEGKFNARLADAEKQWKAKLDGSQAEWTAKEAQYQREIDRRVRKTELQKAFAERKARTERLETLVRLAEADGSVKVIQKADGSFDVAVVAPDGSPAYSKRTGKLTEPMTLDEIAEQYSKSMPEMFQGYDARGTGAGSALGGNGSAYSMSREAAKSNPNSWYALQKQAAAAGAEAQLTG